MLKKRISTAVAAMLVSLAKPFFRMMARAAKVMAVMPENIAAQIKMTGQ